MVQTADIIPAPSFFGPFRRFDLHTMAGIEVVGVILGSIPLVIGGLERYGKGVSIEN